MPINTKPNHEKAAIRRRQRARIKAGELTKREQQMETDLLQEMIDLPNQDPKVKAIARRAKKSMGAPNKLTPVICSRIVKYLMEGNYLATACKAAGVHYVTFTKWMKQAEAAMETAEAEYADVKMRLERETETAEAALQIAEADEGTEAEEIEELIERINVSKSASDELMMFSFVSDERQLHVHLHNAILMAEAESERSLMKKAAEGKRGWQGAMAVMERRFREGWGKSSEINHNIKGDEDKPVVFSLESDTDRQQRVAGILASAKPGIAHLDPGDEGGDEVVDAEVVESSGGGDEVKA